MVLYIHPGTNNIVTSQKQNKNWGCFLVKDYLQIKIIILCLQSCRAMFLICNILIRTFLIKSLLMFSWCICSNFIQTLILLYNIFDRREESSVWKWMNFIKNLKLRKKKIVEDVQNNEHFGFSISFAQIDFQNIQIKIP